MLKRIYFLLFFLLAAAMLCIACSSDQNAIDRAVQQTVEAQGAIDRAVKETAEAQSVATAEAKPTATTIQRTVTPQPIIATAQPTVAVQQVDSGQGNVNELTIPSDSGNNSSGSGEQLALADEILGIWSGNATASSDRLGDIGPVALSIELYTDLVIVDDGINDTSILRPVSVDAGTIQLESTSDYFDTSAIMEIVSQTSEALAVNLTVTRHDVTQYEAKSLHKVVEVEPVTGESLRDALTGVWKPVPMGPVFSADDLIEFVDDQFVFYSENGDPFPEVLFQYDYIEPTRMLITTSKFPEYEQANIDLSMPDKDTLILLIQFMNPEDAGGTGSFPYLLRRISGSKITTQRPENEVLYPFWRNGNRHQCGYIDRTGAVVVEPKFEYCKEFYEGLAAVKFGYWGFIDNSGAFKILPQSSLNAWNSYFFEGLASVVDQTGKWGFIDKEGRYVIAPQYDFAGFFSEGLAPVSVSNTESQRTAFIDNTGKVVLEINDTSIASFYKNFHDGLLSVQDGYVNTAGQLVIELRENHTDFSEGLARVGPVYENGQMVSPGCYYIDTTGQTAIQTSFEQCGNFYEGLASVVRSDDHQCGYINRDGDLVIDIRFDFCGPFSEERAQVSVGDYRGYIDTQGNYIFKPYAFTEAQFFHYGLAMVEIDDRMGYIDRDGNYVLEP